MYKHISNLTEKDKAKILASYRNHAIRSYGMDWDEWANHIIQKEIDQIFDGGDLSRFSSMQYEKARAAREFFNGKPEKLEEKPEPLEFLIWQSMKADGTVYVPSKMPVRAELKTSKDKKDKAETSAKTNEIPASSKTPVNITTASTVSTDETTLKPATSTTSATSATSTTQNTRKARKTEQRATNRQRADKKVDKKSKSSASSAKPAKSKKSERLDMLHKTLDEMFNEMFNAYVETEDGSILPIWLPDEYFIKERHKERQKARLHDHLRKAIVVIQKNPNKFYEHPDFLSLIEMAKNTHGAFRLTASFPSSFLKGRENLEALKLLPLPVKIGKVTNIAAATGNDEDMVTFDWFSTDDPKPDKETMMLISEFLGEMLKAMNIV